MIDLIFNIKPLTLNFDLVKLSTFNPSNKDEYYLFLQCKEIPIINKRYFDVENIIKKINKDYLLAALYNYANKSILGIYTYYDKINYTENDIINKFRLDINRNDKVLLGFLRKNKFKNDIKIFISNFYSRIKELIFNKI